MRSGTTSGLPVRKAVAAAIVAGGLVATIASASHLFADVPNSAIYHDAVDWIADRLVTTGCATGLYCPDDAVTRAQMALFMQRLGNALTPTVLTGSANVLTGAFQPLSGEAVYCQTGSYTPAFTRRVVVHSAFGFHTTAGFSFEVEPVSSIDGVNWNALSGQPGRGGKASAMQAHSAGATDVGTRLLAAGVTYRFGTRVRIVDGAGILGSGGCEVMATMFNSDTPLIPLPTDANDGL